MSNSGEDRQAKKVPGINYVRKHWNIDHCVRRSLEPKGMMRPEGSTALECRIHRKKNDQTWIQMNISARTRYSQREKVIRFIRYRLASTGYRGWSLSMYDTEVGRIQ